MKPLTQTLIFLESNTAKNMIIVFGIALSIFTITSFDSISNAQRDFAAKNIPQENMEEIDIADDLESNKPTLSKAKKAKTQHNFIASYFLQESSIKRERKNSDSDSEAVSKMRQLHKILISTVISSF